MEDPRQKKGCFMLNGIRIIDFSQYLPGPHTTLRLAEMGAEVIKVEAPQGDPARGSDGKGFVFLAQNRNKKSITLNLKDERDRRSALDLIKGADIVVESFRPGTAGRLGIGYEDVLQINEGIIYCSITGYGQSGPMSTLGGHDINYLAVSGLLSQLKDENGRPVQPSATIADFAGGIAASEAILGALVKKLKTGEGSYLDISITDSLLPYMSNHILIEQATGRPDGISSLNNKHICYFIYETQEGRFVSLGALEPKFWANFCRAVHKEEWLQAQYTAARPDNPVFQEMRKLFLSRPLSDWMQLSMEADCCLAPVLETRELADCPAFKERGLLFEKEGIRYTSSHFPGEARWQSAPPKLGQHDELLTKKQ